MRLLTTATCFLTLFTCSHTCDDHDWTSPILGGYVNHDMMKRHDLHKRIQPGALPARPQPIRNLQWGQINFLHTTDTHGWLAGHLLDENYSADYGDFGDFIRKMKAKADYLGVDLLLVDSGDLHDGTGFGDATTPNGKLTLPIFQKVPYDLLSIGNHELYTTEIANDTYNNFAPKWGGRYLTANVDIYQNGTLVPFSQRYAYWTTKFGIRIMSFAFLYNFTGNSNATVVTPVGNVLNQTWFQTQVRRTDIDMFLIAGHITLRDSTEWDLIYSAIRQHHPRTPINIFGGHRHIRDAVVWDSDAVGIASGRYCETVGWLSINGISSNVTRAVVPKGSNTTRITGAKNLTGVTAYRNSSLTYSRQYIDFNRFTFEYHTSTTETTFNTTYGLDITKNITANINSIPGLTKKIGCSPGNYYMSRYPISSNMSIYNYFTTEVFPRIVVAPNRTNNARIVLINTGAVRGDLNRGIFTVDTAYQVLPYTNTWQYMSVPWSSAQNLLANMQVDRVYKRRQSSPSSSNMTLGYVTKDDFGTDGDNTIHIDQGYYDTPHYVQANVSVANITNNSMLVDVYAASFFTAAAAKYLTGNVTDWINVDGNFSTFDTLPRMASKYWSQNC